jgi:hypothetical protein
MQLEAAAEEEHDAHTEKFCFGYGFFFWLSTCFKRCILHD